MPAIYSVDLIAKRDRKIKMDRSIVKGWNVHYQTLEEVEEEARVKKQEAEKKRLEELSDDMSSGGLDGQPESEEGLPNDEEAYNAKTGAYSGNYGKAPVKDEAARQQIDAILKEKPDAFDVALSELQKQTDNR